MGDETFLTPPEGETIDQETNETVDQTTDQGKPTEDNGESGDNTSSDDKTSTEGEGETSSDDEGETGKEEGDTPPDTYADFTLPEGMQVDEAMLEDAKPVFKELGLNQEQAQKLVDIYAKQVQASSQTQIDNFNQLVNDWREQAKNDGEFGGDKFDENLSVAVNAIDKFGTPELKQLLNEYGIGNHPEVIRFMVRVGHTLKEDVPGATGGTVTEKDDPVSILYPNG